MRTNRKNAFARSGGTAARSIPANREESDPVRCGALAIDRTERSAVVAGRTLSLTGREYAVLLCLADRANRVVSRSVLLDTIWTSTDDRGSDVLEVYPWSNVVNVYVNHLRKKLGAYAGMLETIRGYGYCLRPRL